MKGYVAYHAFVDEQVTGLNLSIKQQTRTFTFKTFTYNSSFKDPFAFCRFGRNSSSTPTVNFSIAAGSTSMWVSSSSCSSDSCLSTVQISDQFISSIKCCTSHLNANKALI